MDAPSSEFGYSDLVALRNNEKAGKIIGGKPDTLVLQSLGAPEEVMLVAQAKLNSGKFPVTPTITVDIDPVVENCGDFDWLFIPRCAEAVPKTNVVLTLERTVPLSFSYLHAYRLPEGWKNARIGMATFGKCGLARFAAILNASSSSKLCEHTQYRKRISYRSCSFWRCTTKQRWSECSASSFLIRLVKFSNGMVSTIPKIVQHGTDSYASFKTCPPGGPIQLFLK